MTPAGPSAAGPPHPEPSAAGAKRAVNYLARGEPMVWMTGMALTICAGMIIALLGIVLLGGVSTFWPRPIHLVELASGERLLGVAGREEPTTVTRQQSAEYLRAVAEGELDGEHITPDGRPLSRLYRVGNREVLGQPFRWVLLPDVRRVELPRNALLLERQEWGVWIGLPAGIAEVREVVVPAAEAGSLEQEGQAERDGVTRRVERRVIGPTEDGTAVRVRETAYLAEGEEETLALFRDLYPQAVARRREIEHLKKVDIGRVNDAMDGLRLDVRLAEIRHASGTISDERLGAVREKASQREAELRAEHERLSRRIEEIEREDSRWRFIIRDVSTGQFAPVAQSLPDEPMRLSQIVRAVPANALSVPAKVGVYISRWREFLLDEPRESNTEGGVFPVIFGTVVMTILLSVAVVPMGVIAALYLREYARQGPLVSLVRIAVNNLAGVPSIVYGVFGLGFFCYTVGRYVDAGPEHPWSAGPWLLASVGLLALAAAALAAHAGAKPRPGVPATRRNRACGMLAFTLWIGAASLLILLLATTPFFKGLFRANLPTATYGTKGILWSSLTLALMTLPVVIVATEEAISAVPRSMREASYGCGASKWQTIRRVVLPRAAPGIMTGMILAMARGAGEVAPLMLVGAVKLAPRLPVDASFPYLHPERSFMHLGFHIYDLAFQSPDSEAARPQVWTTTLLLITVIVVLNMTAILIRARLRARFVTGHF